MTTAHPVPHPVHDSVNGPPGHLPNLPRYHPIAMNPNPPPHQMPPPDQMLPNSHFRPFVPLHEAHPGSPPAHSPSSIDHIDARLRQLEHEEMTRMVARTHLLAVRKREDEDFRRMTESAEAEEEVSPF